MEVDGVRGVAWHYKGALDDCFTRSRSRSGRVVTTRLAVSPESVCRRRGRQKRIRPCWGRRDLKNSLLGCERQTEPGKTGAFVRSTGLALSRLCLTYAVCNDTAFVSACSTRPPTRVCLPIQAWQHSVLLRVREKRSDSRPWCTGGWEGVRHHMRQSHGQNTAKVGGTAEGRSENSRTLVSIRPSMSCCSALWQISHFCGGGGAVFRLYAC
jgi:hypothetical protein